MKGVVSKLRITSWFFKEKWILHLAGCISMWPVFIGYSPTEATPWHVVYMAVIAHWHENLGGLGIEALKNT